jgi:hypothetical protein
MESSSNCGRILRFGIEKGELERVKTGWYKFKGTGSSMQAQKDKKQKRRLSAKQLSRLKTLENEMLYLAFKSKLEQLNPDSDIEHLIDRTLEPEEALHYIKKGHPEVRIYEYREQTFEDQFREYLENLGITNLANQDLIISRADTEPFTEDELKAFAAAARSALQEPPTLADLR